VNDPRTARWAWQPTAELAEGCNLARFVREGGFGSYEELLRVSVEDPERFYGALVRFLDWRFLRAPQRLFDDSQGPAHVRWFPDATSNLALNTLERARGTPAWNRTALVWEGEDGARIAYSASDVAREAARFAHALRALGVRRGDVVAIYLPNLPEAVFAMHAVPMIGAIAMPLFSGFGPEAIAARLELGRASVLVTADGTTRRGKPVLAKAIADEAAARVPGLRHLVVVRRTGEPVAMKNGRDHWWHDLVAGRPVEPPIEELPADAPYLLVFTSGTSGRPKGVVHGHSGFPLKMALDLVVTMDLGPRDRMLWMSDMGWVVGPLVVYTAPVAGATLVLVEGAPNYPEPERMWRLVAEHRVSYLGLAPTTARTFMAQASEPWRAFDLSALRIMISSGEPWTPEAWKWLFERVGGARVPLLNFSGGTEMMGILGCCLLRPLKPCSFNTPIPGTGADVVDESGRSVPPGTVGELIMRRPTIGLTQGLWHDAPRYLETYWSTWPGLWHHGDFASRDEDGHWYIWGRSDDVLKIAGKRTGPAEIEALVMDTGRLAEAAVVGVPDAVKGQAPVVVCAPKAGADDEAALARELEELIVRGFGAAFRPRAVVLVPELPKTRNLKIMRRVVRAALLGENAGDLSALVNPESVEAIRARAGTLAA